MSQYPSPYTPPEPEPYYGYTPGGADYLAKPRRAGLLMIVLGMAGLLFGGCMVGIAFMPPQFYEQLKAQSTAGRVPTPSEMTMSGMIILVPSIILILFGAIVRTGRRWAVITSMVMTALLLAYFALMLVMILLAGGQAGIVGTQLLASVAMFGVIIGAFTFQFLGLRAALRSIRELREWQYAQWYASQPQSPQDPPSEV